MNFRCMTIFFQGQIQKQKCRLEVCSETSDSGAQQVSLEI
jgi:hypothetical protein